MPSKYRTAEKFAAVDEFNAGLHCLRELVGSSLQDEGARMGSGCINHQGWPGSTAPPELLALRVVPHNSAALMADFTRDEIRNCSKLGVPASVVGKIQDLVAQFRAYRASVPSVRPAGAPQRP
jgi:hypothetical protein